MDEGQYVLNIYTILVDNKGKIANFSYGGVYRVNDKSKDFDTVATSKINIATQQEIFDKVCRLMQDAPKLLPTDQRTEKPVYIYNDNIFYKNFAVRGHKIYDVLPDGQLKDL